MQSEPAELSIKAASEMLGVPIPTIRSWQRRYGLADPERSVGGHRRYSMSELKWLAAFRDQIDAGVPARVAALSFGDTDPRLGSFLRAAATFDSFAMDRQLESLAKAEGLESAVTDLLMPAMAMIGDLWKSEDLDVAHEHLATQAVRSWMSRRAARAARESGAASGPAAVLAAAPDEHHTIGIEALALLLSIRGWRCRVLGSQTPADSLQRAVQRLAPDATVVSAQLSVNRAGAVRSLRQLSDLGCSAYFGGRAFAAASSRRGVKGTYLGHDLSAAADQIALLPVPPGRPIKSRREKRK
ncbi:MAG: B12-binding domain-containing protein [Actinomycetota bacterium]|nr:MerR family transcriptional regulator [Actinomycetota bacterium]